jgi:two-component system, sensor histidine kinase and response regulator
MVINQGIESIINNCPTLICQISTEGKLIYVNNYFHEILKLNPSELIGNKFETIFADCPGNIPKNFPWSNDEIEFTFEFESEFKIDSKIKWIEWRIKTFKDEKTDDKIFIASGWDITEIKHNEENMIRDQIFFNLLMDIIPDRIYFKDLQSRYLRINKVAARRRNLINTQDALGKTDFDFFTEEHARVAFDDEQKVIATGKMLENIEELETWQNGKKTWASTTKAPFYDKKGNIVGTFGISRDITVRKLAQEALIESEQKLKELNAIKDKFFSIIAHDLRSPFHGLFGLVNILIDDFDHISGTKVKENLILINNEMKNLFHLLEDLLEWGRIQRNAIQFIPTDGNIFNTVKNVVELFKTNAKDKNISVKCICFDEEFIFSYDDKMISTVIRNLLTNAIKFTKNNGSITISILKVDNNISISIEDNGIGIPYYNLNKLFNLNEYFSTKGTSGEGGSGLGLILCKEFIERHGGKITVESEVNKGTKFSFTLPVNT